MTNTTAQRFINLLTTAHKGAPLSNTVPLIGFFAVAAHNAAKLGNTDWDEDAVAAPYWENGYGFPVFRTCGQAAIYARGILMPELMDILNAYYLEAAEELPEDVLNAAADILEKALAVAIEQEKKLTD